MKNNISRIWVSPNARLMGNRLIAKLKVRRGYGIAIYLGVDSFYTNFEAIYLWVDQKLALNQVAYLKLDTLCSAFVDELPKEMAGTIDQSFVVSLSIKKALALRAGAFFIDAVQVKVLNLVSSLN